MYLYLNKHKMRKTELKGSFENPVIAMIGMRDMFRNIKDIKQLNGKYT